MTDRAARIATALGIITIFLGVGHLVGSLGLAAVRQTPYTIRTAHLVWIGLLQIGGGVLECLALAHRDAQPLADRVLRVQALILMAFAITLLPVMLRPLSPFVAGPVFLLASNGWLLARLGSASTSVLAQRSTAG